MVILYLTRVASMSYLSNELERKISIPLAPLCLLFCGSNVSQRHTWILQQLEQTHAVLRCVYTCTVNILCLEPISHCRLNKYTHNGYSCVPLRLQQVLHSKKTQAARSLVYSSLNKYTQATHVFLFVSSTSLIQQLEQTHTGCSDVFLLVNGWCPKLFSM